MTTQLKVIRLLYGASAALLVICSSGWAQAGGWGCRPCRPPVCRPFPCWEYAPPPWRPYEPPTALFGPVGPPGFGQLPPGSLTLPPLPAAAPAPSAPLPAASATDAQLLRLLQMLLDQRERNPSFQFNLEQQLQAAPAANPTPPAAVPSPLVQPPTAAPGSGVFMRQQLGPDAAEQQLQADR